MSEELFDYLTAKVIELHQTAGQESCSDLRRIADELNALLKKCKEMGRC